jgi:hypothetical protein
MQLKKNQISIKMIEFRHLILIKINTFQKIFFERKNIMRSENAKVFYQNKSKTFIM